VLKEKEDQKPV
jgi:hypothetical protein